MGPGMEVEKPRKGEQAVQGIKYHLPRAQSLVPRRVRSALNPAASVTMNARERSLAPREPFRRSFVLFSMDAWYHLTVPCTL